MFNPKWPVWIIASTSQHFLAKAQEQGLIMFCEAEDRHTENLTEYAEFRMNGPWITEPSLNAFRITCDVNMLVSVKKSVKNIYRIHEIAGWLMAACFDVTVFDKGRPEGADPYTEQFHLHIRPDTRVMWQYLGQVEGNTNLLQGIVSVKYEVKLP